MRDGGETGSVGGLTGTTTHAESWPRGHAEPRRPKTIDGRYVVAGELGRGGMGVVWDAWDRQLDRRVAIKALLSQPSPARAARLTLEARSLAQLSHPNVVEVFDVGDIDGRPYLVMQYVDGRTLAAVCGGAVRPRWTEVIALYLQAADGLAAVHAAGLIHRDVKPQNIIVGRDGRVRVVDFGLARVGEDAESEPTDLRAGAARGLTATGEVMGTPLYMAPEQHDARVLTPAADVYGFGVALYGGLYGHAPFGGRTLPDIYTAKARGVSQLKPDPEVPDAVHAVVLQALAHRPSERFEDMGAVAVALRAAAPRRRSVALGVIGASAASVAAVAWGLASGEPSACQRQSTTATVAWAEAHDAVAHQLAAVVSPEAATQGLATVTEYSEAWGNAYRQTCAPQTEGAAGVPEIRRRCLDAQLAGWTARLSAAQLSPDDASRLVLPTTVAATPADCAEPWLARRQPLPSDPARAARVSELYDDAVRLAARINAYQWVRTERPPDWVLEAETLGYGPLAAFSLRLQSLWDASDDRAHAVALLERAAATATSARDDQGAVRAALMLVDLHADAARYELAERWLRQARALIEGVGNPVRLEMPWIQAAIAVRLSEGRADEALELTARGMALAEQPGVSPGVRITMASRRATALLEANEVDLALPALRDVLEQRRELYAPGHKLVLESLSNLAIAAAKAGRPEEAVTNYDELLVALEHDALLHANDRALYRINAADTLASVPGRRPEAIALLRSVVEPPLGPKLEPIVRLQGEGALAHALETGEDFAGAARWYARVVDGAVSAFGERHLYARLAAEGVVRCEAALAESETTAP